MALVARFMPVVHRPCRHQSCQALPEGGGMGVSWLPVGITTGLGHVLVALTMAPSRSPIAEDLLLTDPLLFELATAWVR